MGEEFELGDVVKLKSGGCSMTVTHVGQKEIECSFYTDGRFQSRRLPREAIAIVADDEDSAA